MHYCTYLLGINKVLPIIFIICIVLLVIYNGLMMRNNHKEGIRSAERYLTDLPITIFHQERKYLGRVTNISEGGLAMHIENPIYIPKDDEQVKYCITYNSVEIHFRGQVIHVDEREHGWNFSIKVSFEEDYEKLKYRKLLYSVRDEEKKIWGRSFLFKMVKNLFAVSKRKISSKRRTVRIPVNELCELTDGTVLVLDNYNYEYVRVSLVKGVLMERIVLYPTKSYAMHCTQSPWNPYLFSVDNQKELSNNAEFQELIEEWYRKGGVLH